MLINTLADFPDAVRQIAEEEHVLLLDVNELSQIFFEALGVEGSMHAFVHYPANSWPGQVEAFEDNAHLNTYGAYHLAILIMHQMKKNIPGLSCFIRDMLPLPFPANPMSLFENFELSLSPISAVAKALSLKR